MIGYMMTPEQFPDWFVDLIDARVTTGLDDDQQQRFDRFVDEHGDRNGVLRIVEQFELTAAALALQFDERLSSAKVSASGQNPAGRMPSGLRGKLVQDAEIFFSKQSADHSVSSQQDDPTDSHKDRRIGVAGQATNRSPGKVSRRKSPGEGMSTREVLGWLVAAASIAVLLTGWNPFANPAGILAATKLTVEQELDEFVASRPSDLVRIGWQATDPKSGSDGEVLWSDSEQTGYMVFNNLPLNDSRKSQYQLWIFDTDVGQAHPVDGGTFDVTNLEKSVVKIDARVAVDRAVMFAITEEKPGGVVVSSRGRLPLLAKVN